MAGVVQHSSETPEHYTPAYIVEAARHVLGWFDLDPASCRLGQEVVKAEAWYGPDHPDPRYRDGLRAPWGGRVFLNPPGGLAPDRSSNAALWWATLATEYQDGRVEAAIFVGFTLEILRSSQAYASLQPLDFPICVPASRIAFDRARGPERVRSSSPPHANVIVLVSGLDEAKRRFAEAFGEIGKVKL